MSSRMHRSSRVAGALAGSAVGDALGAPFEFGPPGRFSAAFPSPARGTRTEMCGGGGWKPGEFTDDTQMALLVAASLVGRGDLDEADLFDRFRAWLAAGPSDVGNQTRAVLGSGRPWDVAAGEHFARSGHAAGNGSLMRTTPAAIRFSRKGRGATMNAARRISALTHGDPSAGEGCAVFHDLMRVALDGDDPLAAIPSALNAVAADHRQRWATVLASDWTPDQATEANGAVWPTLGQAVWALRRGRDFTEVLRLVIDLGGDTDTVACVAGGLAGAVFGMGGIPSRWASAVHGRVPGSGDKVWRVADLQQLAAALDGGAQQNYDPGVVPRIGPAEVLPGIWAGNIDGARYSDEDFAVISLCRLGELFPHGVHRMAYIADNEHNADLDGMLADVLDDMAALRAEGQRLLVHCHGGASRTGLVLRGWLVREQGMSVDEATAHVQERWPYLGLWNDSFTAALHRLAARPHEDDRGTTVSTLQEHLDDLAPTAAVRQFATELARRTAVESDRQEQYVSLRPSMEGAVAVYLHRARVSIALLPERAAEVIGQLDGATLNLKTPATTYLDVPEDLLAQQPGRVLDLAAEAVAWRAVGPQFSAGVGHAKNPEKPPKICPEHSYALTPSGACPVCG